MKLVRSIGCFVFLAGKAVADTEVMMLKYKSSGIDGQLLTPDMEYPLRYQIELNDEENCEYYRLHGFKEDELLRIRLSWIGTVPVKVKASIIQDGRAEFCYESEYDRSMTIDVSVENALYTKFNFTLLLLLSIITAIYIYGQRSIKGT